MKPLWPLALRQTLSKIPLGMVLTVPFLLQLLVAVGLVGYWSYRSGQRSVNHLADQLMAEVGYRVNAYLTHYLETPHIINQLNVNALQMGQITPQNWADLEHHFVHQIQVFESVGRIRFSTPQGGLVSAGRDQRGLTAAFTPSRQSGPLTVYSVDQAGNRVERLVRREAYDARTRPFHQAAVAAGQPTWGEVYVYVPETVGLGIPASYPIYDRAGQLQGVFSSDLLLSSIHDFLQRIEIGKQGEVFIMNRTGQLIASSTDELPYANLGSATPPQMLPADHSQEPLINLTAKHLSQRFQGLDQIQDSAQLWFQHEGERQYVQVSPFADDWGLDWLIVTVVPESTFMADIHANNQRTLLLTGLTLLLAAGTGLLTTRWIARPIRRLQLAAAAMSEGKFDYPLEPQGVREVAQLSQFFQQMAQQLDRSFQALKASEQRFETLLEHLPVGINVFDAKAHPVLVNRVGKRLLGQAGVLGDGTGAEALVYPAYKAGTDQPYPTADLPLRRALQGESATVDDLELRWADRVVPLEVTAVPVLDAAGQVEFAINVFSDISDRRRVEALEATYKQELEAQLEAQRLASQLTAAALQESESVLRQLAENLPLFFGLRNLEYTHWFYASPAFETISGYPLEPLYEDALYWAQFLHPEDAGITASLVSAQKLEPTLVEFRSIRSTGELMWIRVLEFPIFDAQGKAERVAVFAEDITHQRLAEDALRQSESINRAILEALPDLIIRMDRDGNYLDVKANQAFLIAPNTQVGSNVYDVLPPQTAQQRLEATHKALATGEIQVFEFSLQIDGQDLWRECRTVPLTDDTVLIVIRDLTALQESIEALRQSEARNRAILSAIPDTISLISTDGIFLDAVRNDPQTDLVPLSVDPIGKHLYDLLPPDVASRKLAAVQQALLTGQPQSYEQQVMIDDTVQYEEVRVVACGDQTALAIVRNVSDQREVDRIKDEFISIVSHELRTPLTAIRGSLGILAAGILADDPDEQTSVLQIALNNSERLVYLVNDILDLERLESGKVQLALEPCDVNCLIHQALESVQTLAQEAGITLQSSPLAAQVIADSGTIVQTLTNLLSNAIKFSDGGSGVRVWAEPWSPSPASPLIRFAVQDFGRGIPADKTEAIFERFQQVDVSDARQRGGTGLGLAICRSIIQQHGGQIWVESELGQGSTFYFTLLAAGKEG